MKPLCSIIIFALLFCSCKQQVRPPAEPAVYHWQQSFNLDPFERTWLEGFGCSTIYLRFFDLDIDETDGQVVPFSVADLNWPQLWEGVVIPTVFITNRSLLDRTEPEVDTLAVRLVRKIDQMLSGLPEAIQYGEIQLDCDWSSKTRDSYFRLLERVHEELQDQNIKLSATIRLHQVKYADRTGIPPVDRGMLMFYNMDDVSDPDTRNSILDLSVARQYLSGFEDYPLPLDLALPLFGWAVWQRADKTLGLLYPFDREELRDTSRVRELGNRRFELRKSTYLDGRYLYAGDQLRLEGVQTDSLQEAVRLLWQELPPQERRIAFFALDPPTVKTYSHEFLLDLLDPQ